MRVEYDPAKNQRNIELRGLSFERVVDFDWDTASQHEDDRQVYPERRFIAYGLIGDRLHVVVYARVDVGIRVISFRKANRREVREICIR